MVREGNRRFSLREMPDASQRTGHQFCGMLAWKSCHGQEHETCPTFTSSVKVITWNMPDPVKAEGTEAERSRALGHLAMELNTRIRLLLTLRERETRTVERT